MAAALRDPAGRENRDHVDIIIALGMAKEVFDWVWCEHALTIGYRSSLTEIVQIIGRATRDAPGKTRSRFTNLIAEPDAGEQAVTEAVNDTFKAIAASLLMEQVGCRPVVDHVNDPTTGSLTTSTTGSLTTSTTGSLATSTTSNTALIDGIRRYVTDVRDLNVDLIDSIKPFGEAYNILAKTRNDCARCKRQLLVVGCSCRQRRLATWQSVR